MCSGLMFFQQAPGNTSIFFNLRPNGGFRLGQKVVQWRKSVAGQRKEIGQNDLLCRFKGHILSIMSHYSNPFLHCSSEIVPSQVQRNNNSSNSDNLNINNSLISQCARASVAV